jgi:hypothetical protein
MVVARFEFKPESADQFVWQAGQTVVEMTFDSCLEVIKFCQEVEDTILGCTVFTGSDIISLEAFAS